jgi:hypothetical protein
MQALAALNHPNVIRFEALYQEGGLTHLVTEYAMGGDLLGVVRKINGRAGGRGGEAEGRRGKGGEMATQQKHLDEDQIMNWFVQVS